MSDWISVKDSLPEEDEIVLVCHDEWPSLREHFLDQREYFTASYSHKYGWSAFREHLDAEGGWDGAVMVEVFDEKYISHWMRIGAPE